MIVAGCGLVELRRERRWKFVLGEGRGRTEGGGGRREEGGGREQGGEVNRVGGREGDNRGR